MSMFVPVPGIIKLEVRSSTERRELDVVHRLGFLLVLVPLSFLLSGDVYE